MGKCTDNNIKLKSILCYIAYVILSFASCSDKNLSGSTNTPPSCSISNPQNNSVYQQGDSVQIYIDATDTDGNIEHIELYINNELAASFAERPYEYLWKTNEFTHGIYSLRAVAVDNDNSSTASNIGIRLLYTYQTPVVYDDDIQTAHASDVGFEIETLEEIPNMISSEYYEDIHSVLIFRNNRLIFEEYFEGHHFDYNANNFQGPLVQFDIDTRQNSHSATKSITSALIGIAIDKGFVNSKDDRISSYFTDHSSLFVDGKNSITIEHLLTMTSGLQWNEMEVEVGEDHDVTLFNQSSDPVNFLLQRPLVNEPGTSFYYNGGAVDLLGELVRISSGISYTNFADQYLFAPLGITNYFVETLWPSGIAAAHGDIKLRPRDMGKFGLLYLNNGVWNGNRIISEEWISSSKTEYIASPTWWVDGYGYLWWLENFTADNRVIESYSARGWGGQYIWVFSELEMVIVFTGSKYDNDFQPIDIINRYILPAIF